MKDQRVLKVLVIILLFVIGTALVAGCLKREKPGPGPTVTPGATPGQTTKVPETAGPARPLSQVKVAVVYQSISDGIFIGRSNDEVTQILKDMDTDLVLRAFFRWQPVPESATTTIPGYPSNYVTKQYSGGHSYQQLGESISQIKAGKPDIIIIGAIAAQRLNKVEYNDLTHESISQEETWAMAFDPAKFNLEAELGNKEEFQCNVGTGLGFLDTGIVCPGGYDKTKVNAYFPDITNEQFQDFLLSQAKKQIDLGADGIWIDMLFSQAGYFALQDGNANQVAMKASYDAASSIVDRIHEYGMTKYGKRIYVGTWSTFIDLPYPPPDLDFITVTPKPAEVIGSFDDIRWTDIIARIKEKKGNIPVFAFIDWTASLNSPLGIFSQSLTPEQQREFLVKVDDYYGRKGINFAYPVHGGTYPTKDAKRLAFGKYGTYDCLAPEFPTYDTIKELARKKAGS